MAAPTAPAAAESQRARRSVHCELVEGADDSQDEVDCGGRRFVLPASLHEAAELPVGSSGWFTFAFAAAGCIVTAAMAAGLTMGLVSLDEFDLDLLLEMKPDELTSDRAREELEDDQRCAERLLPLISKNFFSNACPGCVPAKLDPTNHHYLLVTLLVVNAMANEALPVFLDNLVPAWAAVLISVSFVLVFGEIIPSAIFTGPNQLSIAAKLAPGVKVLKWVLLFIVWPISLMLDTFLGHEEEEGFSRGKIKALVRMHKAIAEQDDSICASTGLSRDEIDIIHGTLDLHRKLVKDIQEPIETAKMLSLDTILHEGTMADVMHWGHSRLFVHEGDKGNIRGLVIVKKFIAINPDDRRPLRQLPLRKPMVIKPGETLLATLNIFQTGASHLAIISADPAAVHRAWETGTAIPQEAQPTGFVTLEDIFEELLKEEVYDEEDREAALGILAKGNKHSKIKGWISNARQSISARKLREKEQREEELRMPLLTKWAKASSAAAGDPGSFRHPHPHKLAG